MSRRLSGWIVGLLSRDDIMRLLHVHSGLAGGPPDRPVRRAIPVADPAEPVPPSPFESPDAEQLNTKGREAAPTDIRKA